MSERRRRRFAPLTLVDGAKTTISINEDHPAAQAMLAILEWYDREVESLACRDQDEYVAKFHRFMAWQEEQIKVLAGDDDA